MADKSQSVSQSPAPVAVMTAPEKAVLAQAKIKTKTSDKHILAARAKRLDAVNQAKG